MSKIFKWSPSNKSGTLRDKTSAETTKETNLKNAKSPVKETIVADTDGSASLKFDTETKLTTHSTGVTVTGTLNVNTVDLGNWTITESSGTLYFATGGTNKMKLDSSGNLTVTGDLTAYGTV